MLCFLLHKSNVLIWEMTSLQLPNYRLQGARNAVLVYVLQLTKKNQQKNAATPNTSGFDPLPAAESIHSQITFSGQLSFYPCLSVMAAPRGRTHQGSI